MLPSFRVRNRLVSVRIRGIGTLRSLRGVDVILVWAFIRPTAIAMPVGSFLGFLDLGFAHCRLPPSVLCQLQHTANLKWRSSLEAHRHRTRDLILDLLRAVSWPVRKDDTWSSDKSGMASIGVALSAHQPQPASAMKRAVTMNRFRSGSSMRRLIMNDRPRAHVTARN